MNKNLKNLQIIILGLIFFASGNLPARAQINLLPDNLLSNSTNNSNSQSNFKLSLSPPTAYLQVKPGEKFTHSVKVTNSGPFTLNLIPHLVEFTPNPDGTPQLLNQNILDQPAYPYANIMTANLKFGQSFAISPGESKNILLSFSPPFTAEVKEHHLTFLMIGTQVFAPDTSTNSSTSISGAIASNIILLVSSQSGDEAKLSIKELKTPVFVDSLGKINIKLLAENQGGNASPIIGKITVAKGSQPAIISFDLYPDMILANSTRWSRGMESQKLQEILAKSNLEALQKTASDSAESAPLDFSNLAELSTKFTYDPAFMFGRYSITAVLGVETQIVTVIALPISLLIGVVIAGLIIIMYLKLKQRFG